MSSRRKDTTRELHLERKSAIARVTLDPRKETESPTIDILIGKRVLRTVEIGIIDEIVGMRESGVADIEMTGRISENEIKIEKEEELFSTSEIELHSMAGAQMRKKVRGAKSKEV